MKTKWKPYSWSEYILYRPRNHCIICSYMHTCTRSRKYLLMAVLNSQSECHQYHQQQIPKARKRAILRNLFRPILLIMLAATAIINLWRCCTFWATSISILLFVAVALAPPDQENIGNHYIQVRIHCGCIRYAAPLGIYWRRLAANNGTLPEPAR
jgi:hypothetical protein